MFLLRLSSCADTMQARVPAGSKPAFLISVSIWEKEKQHPTITKKGPPHHSYFMPAGFPEDPAVQEGVLPAWHWELQPPTFPVKKPLENVVRAGGSLGADHLSHLACPQHPLVPSHPKGEYSWSRKPLFHSKIGGVVQGWCTGGVIFEERAQEVNSSASWSQTLTA